MMEKKQHSRRSFLVGGIRTSAAILASTSMPQLVMAASAKEKT